MVSLDGTKLVKEAQPQTSRDDRHLQTSPLWGYLRAMSAEYNLACSSTGMTVAHPCSSYNSRVTKSRVLGKEGPLKSFCPPGHESQSSCCRVLGFSTAMLKTSHYIVRKEPHLWPLSHLLLGMNL